MRGLNDIFGSESASGIRNQKFQKLVRAFGGWPACLTNLKMHYGLFGRNISMVRQGRRLIPTKVGADLGHLLMAMLALAR